MQKGGKGKNSIILVVLAIILVSLAAVRADNVTSCGTLSSPNTVYTQTANIVPATTANCIIIAAQNITYDCNGFSIYNSTANLSAIYTNQLNTIIKNCNISMGGKGGYARGIELTNAADNSLVFNNILIGNGYGIYSAADYSTITDNFANTTCGSCYGFYLNEAENNIIKNNTGISSVSYGFYILRGSNSNIANNTGRSNSSYGLYIELSNNCTIKNNTGISISSNGFYLRTSNYSLLADNTGMSNSSSAFVLGRSASYNTLINNLGKSNLEQGIHISSSSWNNLISNRGITNGSSSKAAIMIAGSNNTLLVNNTRITEKGTAFYFYVYSNSNTLINNTAITNSSYGIYVYYSSSNYILNQKVEGRLTGSYAVIVRSSNNTMFQDCINVSGVSGDVYLYPNEAAYNTSFINCSYSTSKETVGALGELTRKWYYRAYTNDTGNRSLPHVNVTAFNTTGNYAFNLSTNEEGYTPTTQIIDYYNNAGTRKYSSNYTLFAINVGDIVNHTYNATLNGNNLNDVFTLPFGLIDPDVTTCGHLMLSNAIYVQKADLVPAVDQDCIVFVGENVTYDGNGFSIANPNANASAIVTNKRNSTIKNCNISMGGKKGSEAIGIELAPLAYNATVINNTLTRNYYGIYITSKNSTIVDNYVSADCINCQGIRLLYPHNLLMNNRVIVNSSVGIFVWYTSASDNTLINNVAQSNSSYGIYIHGAPNTLLINNTGISNSSYGIIFNLVNNSRMIGCNGMSENYIAMDFEGGYNNTFINNTAISNRSAALSTSGSLNNLFINQIAIAADSPSSSSYAIYLQTGTNNMIFQDCINVTGAYRDVAVISSSGNNTFLNCSYRTNGANESVEVGSQLIRKWYYQAYVEDVGGNPVVNSNVTAFNKTSNYAFNLTTDQTGYTPLRGIIEYVNNGTRKYYNDYTIFATNITNVKSHSYNVTFNLNNLRDVFTVGTALCESNTYYVDFLNGNDDNDGDCSDAAWKHAPGDYEATSVADSTSLLPGDTVKFKGGMVYNGMIDLTGSGTSGNPITYTSYSGTKAIIDGTGYEDSVFDWSAAPGGEADWVALRNLEIRNYWNYGVGIHGNHNTVDNCNIHTGLNGENNEPLFIGEGDYNQITHNEIHDSNWNCVNVQNSNYANVSYNNIYNCPDHGGINMISNTETYFGMMTGNDVHHNYIHDIGPQGAIYTRYQQNNKIYNNIIDLGPESDANMNIYFSEGGTGGPTSYTANTKVYNNIIIGGKYSIFNDAADNILIENNIIKDPADLVFVEMYDTTSGHVLDYNLYSGLGGWRIDGDEYYPIATLPSPYEEQGLVGDPGFTDEENNDFTYTASSDAIDNGDDLSSSGVITDYAGTSRPQGSAFDIGAYEYF